MDDRFGSTNKEFVFLDGLEGSYVQSFKDLIKKILGDSGDVKSFLTKIWDPIGSKYNITNYTDNTNYRELFNNAFREETRGLIHIDYNVSKNNVNKDNALKITVILVKDTVIKILKGIWYSINKVMQHFEFLQLCVVSHRV